MISATAMGTIGGRRGTRRVVPSSSGERRGAGRIVPSPCHYFLHSNTQTTDGDPLPRINVCPRITVCTNFQLVTMEHARTRFLNHFHVRFIEHDMLSSINSVRSWSIDVHRLTKKQALRGGPARTREHLARRKTGNHYVSEIRIATGKNSCTSGAHSRVRGDPSW